MPNVKLGDITRLYAYEQVVKYLNGVDIRLLMLDLAFHEEIRLYVRTPPGMQAYSDSKPLLGDTGLDWPMTYADISAEAEVTASRPYFYRPTKRPQVLYLGLREEHVIELKRADSVAVNLFQGGLEPHKLVVSPDDTSMEPTPWFCNDLCLCSAHSTLTRQHKRPPDEYVTVRLADLLITNDALTRIEQALKDTLAARKAQADLTSQSFGVHILNEAAKHFYGTPGKTFTKKDIVEWLCNRDSDKVLYKPSFTSRITHLIKSDHNRCRGIGSNLPPRHPLKITENTEHYRFESYVSDALALINEGAHLWHSHQTSQFKLPDWLKAVGFVGHVVDRIEKIITCKFNKTAPAKKK